MVVSSILTNHPMKKIINEIASLCICDYHRFKPVIDILKKYNLFKSCSTCKHYMKDCDAYTELECGSNYPPTCYEKE